jgi:hypothetical protein
MRAMTMAVAICLAVGACAPTAEQRLQQVWAERQLDEDKCTSYGAKPGDPAYVQCRAQLDAARTGAEATAAAKSTTVIVNGAPPAAQNTIQPPRDPMAGHTSDPGWRGLPGRF